MSQDTNDIEIPYIFRRQSVTAGRTGLSVMLRKDVLDDLSDAEWDLTSEFTNDKVYDYDVREAIIITGLKNIDEVKETMREMGFGHRG